MWFIPYERFSIITQLSAEEVTRAIISSIYISNVSSFKEYDTYATKYFTGWVQNQSFQLKRNIVYGSKEIPPYIKGEITTVNSGAEIQVEISSFMATLLMCVAISFLLIGGICMSIQSKHPNIIPFIMIIPAYLIILLPFKAEAKKIKNIMLDISEGNIKKA